MNVSKNLLLFFDNLMEVPYIYDVGIADYGYLDNACYFLKPALSVQFLLDFSLLVERHPFSFKIEAFISLVHGRCFAFILCDDFFSLDHMYSDDLPL